MSRPAACTLESGLRISESADAFRRRDRRAECYGKPTQHHFSNTLGLLAGPYRFTLAWPVRGFTHATFPRTGSALWHFAKILVPRLRAMPGTLEPVNALCPVLKGGPTDGRTLKGCA